MDELIGRLRANGELFQKYIPNAEGEVLLQAADAIEKLSAYVLLLEELRKDGWYLQKTKMMTYGQATMTQPLPEPPKEE